MPTRDEHLAKARQNEAAAATNEKEHPEWAVTALFYAALHYIEAYWYVTYAAEGYQPHCESHEERGRAIQKYLRPIYNHYRALERSSREARYGTSAFTEYDVRDLRERRLEPVKRYILQAIAPPRRRGPGHS